MADKQRSDQFFSKVSSWFTKTVSRFVAGLFLLVGLGELYAIWVKGDPFLFALPFILALLAYYSRDFALLVLGLLVALVFLFPL